MMITKRHAISAFVHSQQTNAWLAPSPGRKQNWLHNAAYALLDTYLAIALTGCALFVSWWSRQRGRTALPDGLLCCFVVCDAFISSLNSLVLLEYASFFQEECNTTSLSASLGACILRGYWPATHLAFTTKWVGSALPNQIVFFPELVRATIFVVAGLAATATVDGVKAALRPTFLAALLALALVGFAYTLFCVAAAAPGRFGIDAVDAVPPRLLGLMCPRFLRRWRDTACAAAIACVAALEQRTGLGLHTIDGRGIGPAGRTGAFSVALAILLGDSHVTLRTVGRVQVSLFIWGIALALLGQRTHLGSGPRVQSGAALQPRLSWSEVVLEEELGYGSFATVFRARWRGTPVAIKRWHAQAGDGETILMEAELIMALRHPNVLPVFGLLPSPRALVMALGGCTLRTLLQLRQPLPWLRRVELALGVASGMDYLHQQSVIHGDLTCSNILVSDSGVPKLADFGMSFVSLGGRRHRGTGTLTYAAPELLRSGFVRLPKAVDAYAYGIVLQLIADPLQLTQALLSRSGTQLPPGWVTVLHTVFMRTRDASGAQPQLPASVPQPIAQLVRDCCSGAPDERPTFAEVRMRLHAALDEAAQWLAG